MNVSPNKYWLGSSALKDLGTNVLVDELHRALCSHRQQKRDPALVTKVQMFLNELQFNRALGCIELRNHDVSEEEVNGIGRSFGSYLWRMQDQCRKEGRQEAARAYARTLRVYQKFVEYI
ncbi:MAG: hypothetical protein AABW64_01925 [Nanoarchaeota archaeon]